MFIGKGKGRKPNMLMESRLTTFNGPNAKFRLSLVVVAAMLLPVVALSQDYQEEFGEYFQAGDTINQLKVLSEWQAENPTDPELFTSFLNYYFAKSRREVVTLSEAESDDTSPVVAHLGAEYFFEQSDIDSGLRKIDEGILLYPDRLDMRFGKIYALGQVGDWESFTAEILEIVRFSAKEGNDWLWTDNEKLEDGREFFLSAIQGYQVQLYNTGSDDLLVNMRHIAEEVLQYYPNNVESLSNLAITFMLAEEYDKAIEQLKKAEVLYPEDGVILSNIAHGYVLKGENDKAIEYYEKVIQHGDESTKEYARQKIIDLKQ